jgi:hypothetical protein
MTTLKEHFLASDEYKSLPSELIPMAIKQLEAIILVHNAAIDGCVELLEKHMEVTHSDLSLLKEFMLKNKESM